MMYQNLEQNYKKMIETENFSGASNIAFQIAEILTKDESGWCGCTQADCQKWMELGYENAVKSKNPH